MHWYCWVGLLVFIILIGIAVTQDGGGDPQGGP